MEVAGSRYIAARSFVVTTAALRRCAQSLQDSISFRKPVTTVRKSATQIEVLIILHNLEIYVERLRLLEVLWGGN